MVQARYICVLADTAILITIPTVSHDPDRYVTLSLLSKRCLATDRSDTCQLSNVWEVAADSIVAGTHRGLIVRAGT